MELTVVIVNYRVKYLLEQTLRSVEQAMQGIAGEVIVVDNLSGDDSIAFSRERHPEVTYIENQENVGFARANNQAIMQARGKYTLILNPDTIITPQCLQEGIAWMKSHPKCGAIGARMMDGNGVFLPESKRSFPTPWVSFCKIFGLSKLFPRSRWFAKYHLRYLSDLEPQNIDILSGAYMLCRTKLLQQLGGFDEDFFMYGEDIDLSYRMLRAGYDNYYIPTLMLHYKGESSNKNTYHYVHIFYQAMYIFFRKHYGNYNWALSLPIRLAIYMKGASEYVVRQIWLFTHRNRTLLGDMQHRLFLLKGSNRSMETMVAICEKYGLNYEQNHHTATPPDYIVYDTDAFSYGQILQELESQASQPGKHPLIATYSSIQRCIITGDMVFEA